MAVVWFPAALTVTTVEERPFGAIAAIVDSTIPRSDQAPYVTEVAWLVAVAADHPFVVELTRRPGDAVAVLQAVPSPTPGALPVLAASHGAPEVLARLGSPTALELAAAVAFAWNPHGPAVEHGAMGGVEELLGPSSVAALEELRTILRRST